MSSGRRNNRHYWWINRRDQSAAYFAELGLPIELLMSEQKFVDFATTARRDDLSFDLESLSEAQFRALFHFATCWFDMRAAGFTAMEKRRVRGGRPAGGE